MIRAFALAISLSLAGSSAAAAAETEQAIFAGGCFWCVESDFDKVPGVLSTTSGYIGGENDNPTYENHTRYRHREAVLIEYDAGQVSYEQLLHSFFRSVDPLDAGGQFCDRGFSYSTAVYALDEGQLDLANAAKAYAESVLGQEVATEVVAAPTFWPAEEYHQDFYRKNPLRYTFYRNACGRDQRVREVWGDQALAGIGGS
ncbi:MAG: peptide-methionine (S)-S-oxide reductase MsrA [Rhizobiaceae bacterium]